MDLTKNDLEDLKKAQEILQDELMGLTRNKDAVRAKLQQAQDAITNVIRNHEAQRK